MRALTPLEHQGLLLAVADPEWSEDEPAAASFDAAIGAALARGVLTATDHRQPDDAPYRWETTYALNDLGRLALVVSVPSAGLVLP